MPDPRYDLGVVSRLNADAIGEPGQRRFRVRAEGPGGSVLFWLEKGQLQGLALAIHRVLATSPQGQGSGSAAPPSHTVPPQNLDFQVGGVTLGYDERSQVIGIAAEELGTAEESPPLVRIWATREQAAQLADEALEVAAAGRPLCPLCHAPIDEGVQHICPAANGYPGS